jgi:hypothetical protein
MLASRAAACVGAPAAAAGFLLPLAAALGQVRHEILAQVSDASADDTGRGNPPTQPLVAELVRGQAEQAGGLGLAVAQPAVDLGRVVLELSQDLGDNGRDDWFQFFDIN